MVAVLLSLETCRLTDSLFLRIDTSLRVHSRIEKTKRVVVMLQFISASLVFRVLVDLSHHVLVVVVKTVKLLLVSNQDWFCSLLDAHDFVRKLQLGRVDESRSLKNLIFDQVFLLVNSLQHFVLNWLWHRLIISLFYRLVHIYPLLVLILILVSLLIRRCSFKSLLYLLIHICP